MKRNRDDYTSDTSTTEKEEKTYIGTTTGTAGTLNKGRRRHSAKFETAHH